ncbi:MAG: GTP 3',8-cyclase MoaA [Chthoniobacteraceae bacterium]
MPYRSAVPAAASDALQRPLRDLRISVTDRCNFRCTYCMPREVFGGEYPFLPKAQILSFEEITRLAGAFVRLGVQKLRLTGGEPLLRRDLDRLVAMLAAIPGIEEVTLTTNGSLLSRMARTLREAGLTRVTVSLDSLRPETFQAMSDAPAVTPEDVLRGIDAALDAGFGPIKINMVVRRGLNDDEVVEMASRFSGPDYILRFIEYMDVGNTNGWNMREVVPAAEILERLGTHFELRRLPAQYGGEVAQRWALSNGGEVGMITSVTQPFCGGCTRARLSSDGKLYTCLFAATGWDLREPLRAGAGADELESILRGIWEQRRDRYSEIRHLQTSPAPKAEMSLLGG